MLVCRQRKFQGARERSIDMSDNEFTVHEADGYWIGRFDAMASPCEILMEVDARNQAHALTAAAWQEAVRIERTFSRYRDDNVIYRINHARGRPVEVDHELAGLLDYADQCYRLSEGRFDITSGVLRRAWTFDGSDNIPDPDTVRGLLNLVGWNKVNWTRPVIVLPEGMQIDLGGIGKEYAVDRAAILLQQQTDASFLINFGGDMYVNKPRQGGQGWVVGIENPDIQHHSSQAHESRTAVKEYELSSGGIATSGDARRYLLKDGVRYAHILDPLTGWPVRDAPRSVTVAAGSCTEAGILSTLAMLQGKQAEAFLQQQDVTYWCIR